MHSRNDDNKPRFVHREVAIASIALVTILTVMGLLLWIVASHAGAHQDNMHADSSADLAPSALLNALVQDLGAPESPAEVEAAVEQWLLQQQRSQHRVVLASS